MSQVDWVATRIVEGVSKAANAWIERLAWGTVSRWLELSAVIARRFNNIETHGYSLEEIQLDELNTFLGNRNQKSRVFAGIEVWSRLWSSSQVGPRSYSNGKRFIRSVVDTCTWSPFQVIRRDGMKFYGRCIALTSGVACVHAQVNRRIKQNRVVRIWTKLVIGSEWRLEDAPEASEYSTNRTWPTLSVSTSISGKAWHT